MTQRVPVISPELVLVDPALADKARAELPGPGEFVTARLRAAQEQSGSAVSLEAPLAAPSHRVEPQRPSRRRTRALRRVLVAAVFLLAGFAFGRMTAAPPPGFIIEQVDNAGSSLRSLQRSTPDAAASPRSEKTKRLKRPSRGPVVAGARHGRGAKAKRRNAFSAAAPPRRSRNVLGVIVSVSPRAVTIRWRAPTSSRRVIVLRRKRGAKNQRVVYRGTRPWLRDSALEPGTYTYVIVNYDRGRRASSGVPTVVEVAASAF
jgi:hypothetical protein